MWVLGLLGLGHSKLGVRGLDACGLEDELLLNGMRGKDEAAKDCVRKPTKKQSKKGSKQQQDKERKRA